MLTMEPRAIVVPGRWSSVVKTCAACGLTRALHVNRETWGRCWYASERGFAASGWIHVGKDVLCFACFELVRMATSYDESGQFKSDISQGITNRFELARMDYEDRYQTQGGKR